MFLAGLERLSALLEEELIHEGINTTRLQVESLLEDSVISWRVDWEVPQEWHKEVKKVLDIWDGLRAKMRVLLVHVWFSDEAGLVK